MKLKNLFLGSFALTAMLFAQSCDDKNDGPTGAPSIELSTQTLDFEKDGGSQTIKLTATRDWNVTNVPDWIAVDPKSGNPAENKEVTVTVLENTGMDRSQDIKFTIGFDGKTLTVNQKGTGAASEVVVYHNDFDKELAVKGESGWKTYLDSFDGWKNETGSGISTVEYAFSGMSARTNSSGTSNSQYSDYSGSGKNYLWFAKDNYFHVKNITLPEGKTNYTISFGSERNLYQAADNTFVPEEFLVYVSNDGSKWVKLEYAFPNGLKNRRWDLASSTFTVPSGTKSLHIYIKATLASAYLMDDLDLSVAASAGTAIDFSKGIDLGTGGSTGGGETPEPAGNTIAAVCAAAAGSAADLKDVLVTGVTTQSYVITDETGSVLVFVKADPKVKVGDKVNVAGTTGEHNGLIQITAPTTTVVSSNNTVTYPAPLEFTEANLADTPKKVTYVSFTGEHSRKRIGGRRRRELHGHDNAVLAVQRIRGHQTSGGRQLSGNRKDAPDSCSDRRCGRQESQRTQTGMAHIQAQMELVVGVPQRGIGLIYKRISCKCLQFRHHRFRKRGDKHIVQCGRQGLGKIPHLREGSGERTCHGRHRLRGLAGIQGKVGQERP